jgi:hypothetical protein
MTHRHQAGRATGSFVLLLFVVTVAGGLNYSRNLQSEKATADDRPYEGYSLGDLESLRAAYASELQGVRADFDSAKQRRARSVGDMGSLAGNVEQFQKTTRASTTIRNAAASLARSQDQIEQLDRELEIRSQFGEGLARHIKRLTTI